MTLEGTGMNMERIILCTGGTGGHIFPAIAVAQEIQSRNPSAIILFMGSADGAEADMVAKAGFDFVGLPVRGIIGKGMKGATNALRMVAGIIKARSIIKKIKPQVVLGFGGFAAFAGTYAGRLAGCPTALHEQNSYPGLANRVLGKRVQKVFLSMPAAEQYFPKEKCVHTGNPVRQSIGELHASVAQRQKEKASATRPMHLLVMGGSLGAAALNTAMGAVGTQFLDAGIEILHQTGAAGYEAMRRTYRDLGMENIKVQAFIDDMAAAYQWADLVLCRAGASSLAELAVAGLPAVLVPFPHAAQDHQRKNAFAAEEAGSAIVLDQSSISGEKADRLATEVLSLLGNKARLATMAEAAHAQAKPDATIAIVQELEAMATT